MNICTKVRNAAIAATGIMSFVLITGCASNPQTQDQTSSPQSNGSPSPSVKLNTANKPLIVYFSVPETDNPNNMSSEEKNSTVVKGGEVLGNTQYMAQVIADHTAGDLWRIEAIDEYPLDHSALIDRARREQAESARPEIKSTIGRFDDYDTVFVGYPNWWADMPMILYTFFDDYDFAGKTIIPFNTHGGSGFSNTIQTIAGLEPDATVLQDGLSISRNNIADAEPDIVAWLEKLGFDGITSSADANGSVQSSDDQSIILSKLRERCDAMVDADIDALSRLLDDNIILTHMSGQTQTKDEWLAQIADGELDYQNIDIKNPEVSIDGDNASVSYTSVITGNIYGSQGTWTMNSTAAYARQNGEWIWVGTARPQAQ